MALSEPPHATLNHSSHSSWCASATSSPSRRGPSAFHQRGKITKALGAGVPPARRCGCESSPTLVASIARIKSRCHSRVAAANQRGSDADVEIAPRRPLRREGMYPTIPASGVSKSSKLAANSEPSSVVRSDATPSAATDTPRIAQHYCIHFSSICAGGGVAVGAVIKRLSNTAYHLCSCAVWRVCDRLSPGYRSCIADCRTTSGRARNTRPSY